VPNRGTGHNWASPLDKVDSFQRPPPSTSLQFTVNCYWNRVIKSRLSVSESRKNLTGRCMFCVGGIRSNFWVNWPTFRKSWQPTPPYSMFLRHHHYSNIRTAKRFWESGNIRHFSCKSLYISIG
jgi:hypothetical protein